MYVCFAGVSAVRVDRVSVDGKHGQMGAGVRPDAAGRAGPGAVRTVRRPRPLSGQAAAGRRRRRRRSRAGDGRDARPG